MFYPVHKPIPPEAGQFNGIRHEPDERDFPDCGMCGRIYIEASCPEHGALEPPLTHEAKAVRHRRPGGCWRAECGCGWRSWFTGKEDAQHLAEAHSEGRMR